MKRIGLYYILLVIALSASTCFAAGGDDILGAWSNEEKDAKIEVFKCGDKYCGKIVWLKEPDYPADSKEGAPGTPKLDHKNPNKEFRKTPLIGLTIVHDFVFAEGTLWSGGTVYDPKNGKTYSGKMRLVSHDRLDLRGYIGISLIGRTTTWTR